MNHTRSQSASPRLMDKLQQHYKQQSYANWIEHKNQQNLYYRVAQLEGAKVNQLKNMQKEYKQKQDEKIKEYWKIEEEKYREIQRKRRQEIDNTRKVNNSMLQNLMTDTSRLRESSMDMQNSVNSDQIYAQFMAKQRKQKEIFLRKSEEYEKMWREQQKNNKQMEIEIGQLKLQEREQQERKRQAELKRIRDKYQQNMATYNQLDQKYKKLHVEQDKLQDYFAVKGAEDHYKKLQAETNAMYAKDRQRKDIYMKDLSQQMKQDAYRSEIQKRIVVQNQRNSIQARNRYFSEMDKINRMRKSEQDKKVLETLKDQIKPRRLLPEPQAPVVVGNSSPVNIGKTMSDDRKKQLQWIQRNLLREIIY